MIEQRIEETDHSQGLNEILVTPRCNEIIGKCRISLGEHWQLQELTAYDNGQLQEANKSCNP